MTMTTSHTACHDRTFALSPRIAYDVCGVCSMAWQFGHIGTSRLTPAISQ